MEAALCMAPNRSLSGETCPWPSTERMSPSGRASSWNGKRTGRTWIAPFWPVELPTPSRTSSTPSIRAAITADAIYTSMSSSRQRDLAQAEFGLWALGRGRGRVKLSASYCLTLRDEGEVISSGRLGIQNSSVTRQGDKAPRFLHGNEAGRKILVNSMAPRLAHFIAQKIEVASSA